MTEKFKLVPVEPTPEMLKAGAKEVDWYDHNASDCYRAMLAEAISYDDLAAIRLYLQQQRAYGRDDFRAMVEAKTQRFAGVREAHRPRKSPTATEPG